MKILFLEYFILIVGIRISYLMFIDISIDENYYWYSYTNSNRLLFIFTDEHYIIKISGKNLSVFQSLLLTL